MGTKMRHWDKKKKNDQKMLKIRHWRSNPPKNPRPLINFLGQITLAAHPLRGSYFRLEQFSAV